MLIVKTKRHGLIEAAARTSSVLDSCSVTGNHVSFDKWIQGRSLTWMALFWRCIEIILLKLLKDVYRRSLVKPKHTRLNSAIGGMGSSATALLPTNSTIGSFVSLRSIKSGPWTKTQMSPLFFTLLMNSKCVRVFFFIWILQKMRIAESCTWCCLLTTLLLRSKGKYCKYMSKYRI